jgi:predicted nucleotidyltransferase
LAAGGGYGRRELHLHSDIDLLILIPDGTHDIHQQSLSKFLAFLWDVGLEVATTKSGFFRKSSANDACKTLYLFLKVSNCTLLIR